MDHADAADAARRLGGHGAAREHYVQALEQERAAALLVKLEPSRSIMYRSAACLALEVGDMREAERLICHALAGDPPAEIADELRDLLEEATFKRHLDLRGLELAPDEVRMAMWGSGIAPGMAKSESVTKRMEDFSKMLIRTAERKARQPFRERGEPQKAIRDELELYVSTPRAASMAIGFRLARPKGQEPLFPLVGPAHVVNETLACLDLLNGSKDAELRDRIPEDSYYLNFISLARAMAPDGKELTTVAFTHDADGQRFEVPFKRPARTIKPFASPNQPVPVETEITGRLNFADARESSMGTVAIGGRKVTVPIALMNDVVRPLWDQEVRATCLKDGEHLRLINIAPAVEGDGEREA